MLNLNTLSLMKALNYQREIFTKLITKYNLNRKMMKFFTFLILVFI